MRSHRFPMSPAGRMVEAEAGSQLCGSSGIEPFGAQPPCTASLDGNVSRRPAMFRLIWIASTHVRSFMRHWMPTNILLDKLRTRRGLKFGPLALLLAVAYFYLASLLTVIIDGGGPRWLYLLVLLCVWNAFKFLWTGPVS